MNWKDTSGVWIRIMLSKYEDEDITYLYESPLDDLLGDDDGGAYGFEQAMGAAAREVDGDHNRFDEWQVISVEYGDENE